MYDDGSVPASTGATGRPGGRGKAGLRPADILRAATRLFAEKGYSDASSREIAELLGIRKASLYHHISSKEDLLYTVCREAQIHVRQAVDSAVASVTTTYVDRIRAAAVAHLRTALEDREVYSVLLRELRHLPDDQRHEIVAMRDEYEELLQRLIEAGQKDGELRTDVSARMLTLAMLNTLSWTMFWYSPDHAMTPTELAELLVTTFLEGALPR